NDPGVRRAMALAVARRQWEPASVAEVADLRRWAAFVIGEAGASTPAFPPTSAGFPATQTPAATIGPAEAQGEGVAEARSDAEVPVDAEYSDDPASSRAADPVRPAIATAAAPARPASTRSRRVLVTGAGGAAGIAVIRELKQRGERVVAVDADPMA